MTDILEKIKEYKLEEVKNAKLALPIKDLEDIALEADSVRFFADSLKNATNYTFFNRHGIECSGHYVVIAVKDTGHGIDESNIEKVYDPFFTTKEVGAGSGLGLSVVQGIVEQHQGNIEIVTK